MSALTASPNRWIELDDCTLPYWKVGSGPDVLFVHGWPLDGRTWRNIVSELSSHFTCHVFDLPGVGQSRWSKDTAIGMREHAERIEQVVDAVGLRSYALVGHDSGGAFARVHAAAHPDRVWGMVLGNTEIPGHHPFLLKALIAANKLPGSKAAFRTMLSSKILRRLPMAWGGCFADVSFVDGDYGELFVRPLLEDDRAFAGQMLLAQNLDLAAFDDLAEAHAAITAPVTLIWGEDDPWFPIGPVPRHAGSVRRPGRAGGDARWQALRARGARCGLGCAGAPRAAGGVGERCSAGTGCLKSVAKAGNDEYKSATPHSRLNHARTVRAERRNLRRSRRLRQASDLPRRGVR